MVTQDQQETREKLLSYDESVVITCDWVKYDTLRRKAAANVVWDSEDELPQFGSVVLMKNGRLVSTVVDYGIKMIKQEFQRAIWVKLETGKLVKLVASEFKTVEASEIMSIRQERSKLARSLSGAGKKVETQRRQRRQKQVHGSHLLDLMLKTVTDCELLECDEKSSFYKITGTVKKRAVYVAIKGGRVDTSGFCFEHEALTLISAEDAYKRHLGKVRGTIDFMLSDEKSIEAFNLAMKYLKDEGQDV